MKIKSKNSGHDFNRLLEESKAENEALRKLIDALKEAEERANAVKARPGNLANKNKE
jgi:hypothetical protein